MAGYIVVPYLLLGMLISLWSYVTGPRASRFADRDADHLLTVASSLRRRQARLSNLRWETGRLLQIPVVLVGWQNAVLIRRRTVRARNYRDVVGRVLSLPLGLMAALAAFAFAVLLVALRLWDGPGWPVDLGCITLLAALLGRFLGGAISTIDLPAAMRRNRMPPYLQFALIALLDFLSLLLVAALLERLRGGGRLDLAALLSQARDLAGFTHVVDALTGTARTPVALLLTVTGVAYFALIAKLLLQFKQFVRQPKDHSFILSQLLSQGRTHDARRYIDTLDADTRADPSIVGLRVQLLMGENEFDKAYQLSEHHFGLAADRRTVMFSTRTADDILGSLLSLARVTELARAQYRQLVAFAVERGISDGCLAVYLPGLLQDLAVQRMWQLLGLDITDERYPITHTFLRWLLTEDGEEEDAARRRLAELQPGSRTDELARLRAEALMDIHRDRSPAPAIEPMVAALENADDLPGWSRCEFSLALEELARRSALLTPALRVRVEQCSRALRTGADAEEITLLQSISDAARIVSVER